MARQSSYHPVTDLSGVEYLTVIDNPGVAGGTGVISPADLAASLAVDPAFASHLTEAEGNARYAPVVSAAAYGVVGDGVIDDTANLQTWITYLTTNGRLGYLPAGTYKTTAKLNFSARPGWGIVGESKHKTVIVQHTDNTPIFDLGTDAVSELHSVRIENLTFDYAAAQVVGNTSAVPILLSKSMYFSTLRSLNFYGGTYGIRTAVGVTASWANTYDDLYFGGTLSLGAIHSNDDVAGSPNNRWGRIGINIASMAGPVVYVKMHSSSIDALEYFCSAGPVTSGILLSFAGSVDIGAIKIESGLWNGPPQRLFDFTGNSQVNIGILRATRITSAPTSGSNSLICIGAGGGTDGFINIGTVDAAADSITGSAFVFKTNEALRHRISVGSVRMANGWVLQDTGGTVSADGLTVRDWNAGHVSYDKGDAAYTVVLGDPNIIVFNTAFTASRIITVPAKAGNGMFNGLTYSFIFNGAINGANTAVIKEGSTTLNTLTVDKVKISYTYRRSAWVLTGYETLP